MNTPSVESKSWLMDEISGTASWCSHVASLFDNDARCLRGLDTLNALSELIQALPDTHPLFNKLAQIRCLDDNARGRWQDEIRLEFSYIGFQSATSAHQAIRQLVKITDASLDEWRQANRLH